MVWVGDAGSAWGGSNAAYQYATDGTPTGTSFPFPWNADGNGPADMAFDPTTGNFWVMAVADDNCIHEMDPDSGATGNTICPTWPGSSMRGLEYDAVSDTFWAGNWYDPILVRFDRSGTILAQITPGFGIDGLAYNPATGHLFAREYGGTIHVLDVAAGYTEIGSFSVAGMAGSGGLSFDCNGNLWGADFGDAKVYQFESGESFPCAGGGLPWLTLTPEDGMVPANEGDLPIDAQFIADGADHFGLFQATIMITHDTPYPVDDVSVCFTKAFDDVPAGYWADAFIHSLAGARISGGCGSSNFCPADLMTRGVMARWLIRAMHGPDYSPPPCTGIFADVICESTANSDYIEALYNEGVTAGCATNPLRYCPNSPVTRSQMAVFLLAAKEGSGYTPPPCTGIFDDVPCPSHWAAGWVEELFNRGITAGCGATTYCPDDNTSRDQMSVFMTVNWDLPMCNSGQ